ncbi:MAG: hypothetical protein JOY99_06865 [Sphingomonadaceae bacterium]|nr:hypothetical protein [Sphingomonadaceae bacterium]
MDDSGFRLDWSRPVAPQHLGERRYHATTETQHILVVVSDVQLGIAEKIARDRRVDHPDVSIQSVLEEAIDRAVATRPPSSGELRIEDGDFD